MRELIDQFSKALQTQAESELLMTVLAQFFDFHPLPAWIKVIGVDGHIRMFRTNMAYHVQTGVNQADYQSKKDTEVWNNEVSGEFEENDRLVIETRAPVETHETAPDAQGRVTQWNGAKWPLFNSKGEVIAIAGFAVGELVE